MRFKFCNEGKQYGLKSKASLSTELALTLSRNRNILVMNIVL